MKWKDSGEKTDLEEKSQEEYFDEEQYSPWSARKSATAVSKMKAIPIVLILLILAVVTSVAALFTLLYGSRGDALTSQQAALLAERVRYLEERMDQYAAIDEKVTRIWEQAQSFERFKERYDRGEASMTLRMDHLTMSLESMQKQLADTRRSTPTPAADARTAETAAGRTADSVTYHTVVAGDTLFSISQRYNLKVDRLRALNRLESDVLLPGQKLIVGSAGAN